LHPLQIGPNELELDFSPAQFSSGIYLVQIIQASEIESTKIILSK
jgi:hypothetical protein